MEIPVLQRQANLESIEEYLGAVTSPDPEVQGHASRALLGTLVPRGNYKADSAYDDRMVELGKARKGGDVYRLRTAQENATTFVISRMVRTHDVPTDDFAPILSLVGSTLAEIKRPRFFKGAPQRVIGQTLQKVWQVERYQINNENTPHTRSTKARVNLQRVVAAYTILDPSSRQLAKMEAEIHPVETD